MASRRAAAIWAFVPALAAALVSSGSLGHGFALDDVSLVRDNPSIQSLDSLPELFLRPYWETPGEAYGLYRPVAVASLAVNRAVAGAGPGGFHAGNVLLHALAAALAWFVARRVGVHYGTALAAALLFAVHPLRVEPVANIAGRAELLAAVGVLGAWILHLRAVESSGRARAGFALGAAVGYAAALLSKESAILAPIVFLGTGTFSKKVPVPIFPIFLGYGVALAGALGLRAAALGGLGGPGATVYLDNPAAFEGTFARVATALFVHAKALFLLVWPARLSSDYSFDAIPVVDSAADPRFAIGLAVALALVAATVLAWKRSRPVAIGLLVWIVFYLPASNLLFATGTVFGERLTYLPAFGIFLVAGHALASLGARRPRLAIAVAALVLTPLAARAVLRVPAWQDNLTLATTDVRTFPRSAKLQAGAGIFLAADGRSEEAERHLAEAVAIWPDYAQARYNLAVLLLRRNATEEALPHLLESARLAPGNPNPARLAAPILEAAGRSAEAVPLLERVVAADPADLDARRRLALALLRMGRAAEAASALRALSAVDRGGRHGLLAEALAARIEGRETEAAAAFAALLSRTDLPEGFRRQVESLRAPPPPSEAR